MNEEKTTPNDKRIIKTLSFEITEKGQTKMASEITEMEKTGWKEISRTTTTGKYKGGKGCCLFLIFAPLALLAGHSKDKIIITFEKYSSFTEENTIEDKPNTINKIKNWCAKHPIITFLIILFIIIALFQK